MTLSIAWSIHSNSYGVLKVGAHACVSLSLIDVIMFRYFFSRVYLGREILHNSTKIHQIIEFLNKMYIMIRLESETFVYEIKKISVPCRYPADIQLLNC